MKFNRFTENQAYEKVAKSTKQLHDKGIECDAISTHICFKELDLDLSLCVTSGYEIVGHEEYAITFVTVGELGFKVIDLYIDSSSLTDSYAKDVTKSLGVLNPEHTQCDIRHPTSMAILHYLELFGKLPQKYKKYI